MQQALSPCPHHGTCLHLHREEASFGAIFPRRLASNRGVRKRQAKSLVAGHHPSGENSELECSSKATNASSTCSLSRWLVRFLQKPSQHRETTTFHYCCSTKGARPDIKGTAVLQQSVLRFKSAQDEGVRESRAVTSATCPACTKSCILPTAYVHKRCVVSPSRAAVPFRGQTSQNSAASTPTSELLEI